MAPCPHAHAGRKSARQHEALGPALERRDGTWHVRSYAHARAVLRASEETTQAGFNAENVARSGLRRPVLFQDGAEHKAQRTAIARFFTPKTVSERYRELMEETADSLVEELRQARSADLSVLTMRMAVQVAARIVGLTESRRPGLHRRLEALLSFERLEGRPRWRRWALEARSHARMLAFYLQDVRPAIRARREAPREDVISHLLSQGYRPAEILVECITYGAAGMATTREFLCMAAWHLLEDEGLRREYLEADEAQRTHILHELLRLEPVVGHLYRRTTAELTLHDEDGAHVIPAGSRVDVNVRAANADGEAVGARPLQACPERTRAEGVHGPVASFGDGTHRCPGAFVAIQESDVFLQRLLRLPLRLRTAPRLSWNDLIEGYELRDVIVEVEEGAARAAA